MRNTGLLLWILPALLTAFLGGCSPRGALDQPSHLVLISLDNLGADHMGCYGYDRKITPFLDSLASKGTLFEEITAQETWTLPSHASMLSSRYVGAHGIVTLENKLPYKNLPLVQESFQKAGFETAAFTTCQFLSFDFGFTRGFDKFRFKDVSADEITPDIIEYLDGLKNDKLFLFLHFYDIHEPFTKDNPYGEDFGGRTVSPEIKEMAQRMNDLNGRNISQLTNEEVAWITNVYPNSQLTQMITQARKDASITMDQIRQLAAAFMETLDYEDLESLRGEYDNGVAFMDHRLSGLFEALKKYSWYEKAVFIITSDHGEAFAEHTGTVGHGKLPFRELVHVPLIFLGPGMPADVRIASPGAIIDLPPTLLDLAGLKVPEGFQGTSLLPAIRNEKIAKRPILSGSLNSERISIFEGRWKLVHDLNQDKIYLFDLKSPAGEADDLALKNPELVKRFKKIVMDLEKNNENMGANLKHQKVELSEEKIAQLRALGYID